MAAITDIDDHLGAAAPRIRADLAFIPTPDGVLLRTSAGGFELKGPNVYALVETLLPMLDGRPLAAILGHLGERQRAAVTRLVQTLTDRGAMLPPRSGEGALDPAVRRAFERQCAFLEHYVTGAEERFAAFRDSRILVCGDGLAATSLIAALLRNGVAAVHTRLPRSATGMSLVERELDDLARRGVPGRLVTSDTSRDDVGDSGVVVYASATPNLADAVALARRCFAGGGVFFPAVALGRVSVMGPTIDPGEPPCWMCAVLRLIANAAPAVAVSAWRSIALGECVEPPAILPPPLIEMLGNAAALELFNRACGHVPAATKAAVVVQDLETLETSRVATVPHPRCPICAGASGGDRLDHLRDLVSGRADREPSARATLADVARYADARAGLFAGFADDDLPQAPVRVSAVHWHDVDGGAPKRAVGLDATLTLNARVDAVAEAVRQYATVTADTAGWIDGSFHELQRQGRAPVAVEDLSSWTGGATWDRDAPWRWHPAFSITHRQVRFVPAAAVFPCTRHNGAGVFTRTSAGLTSGVVFGELLRAGLLSAAAFDAVNAYLRGRGDAVLVEYDPHAAARSAGDALFAETAPWGAARLLELRLPSTVRVFLAGLQDWPLRDFAIGIADSRRDAYAGALQCLIGSLQIGATPASLARSAGQLVPGFCRVPGAPFEHVVAADFDGDAGTAVTDALVAPDVDVLFVDTTPRDWRATKTFVTGVVLLAAGGVERASRTASPKELA